MTSKELSKYIGKYVSFEVDDLAYLPAPEVIGEEDMRDRSNHFEGYLEVNTGLRSHFALDNGCGGIAIRDVEIPFIKNFKVMED